MIVYCQNVWNCNPTEYRNRLICRLIEEQNADICLFQECGPASTRAGESPLPQLLAGRFTEVCPDLAHRNFTPVFCRTDKFNLIDSGYLLYDGLNDADSKSVTWAVLEEKESGFRFAAASTHFWWKHDSPADNAQRIQNARQLREVCDQIISNHHVPVIVGGDLNNGKTAAQGEEPYHVMVEMGFADMRESAPVSTDVFTHHRYPVKNDDGSFSAGPMPKTVLDYLFTYGPHPIAPLEFRILTDDAALSSSDHCPLVGVFGK